MTENKKKANWLWPRIETEAEALDGIKSASGVGVFTSVLLLIISLVKQDYSGLWDVALYGFCAFFLYTKHSRVAAVLAFINYVAGICIMLSEGRYNPGSTFLIAVFITSFITGMRATFFLHKMKKEGPYQNIGSPKDEAPSEGTVPGPQTESPGYSVDFKAGELKPDSTIIKPIPGPASETKIKSLTHTALAPKSKTIPTTIKVFGFALGLISLFVVGAAVVLERKSSMKAEEAISDKEKIKYRLAYAPEKFCSPEFPVIFVVENKHPEKTLKRIEFDMDVYEPGRSQNLVDHLTPTADFDVILPPGKIGYTCYRLPGLTKRVKDPGSLIFKEKLLYGSPEFYAPDEFIPSTGE